MNQNIITDSLATTDKLNSQQLQPLLNEAISNKRYQDYKKRVPSCMSFCF